jgi:glutaredoxin
MKKIFIVMIVGVLLYTGLHRSKPTITPIAPKHNNVVLYATSWCGYCKKTRALLTEQRVQYTEYDVEKSESARKQYEQLNIQGVPVLDVRGLIVGGYDEDEILDALKGMKVI